MSIKNHSEILAQARARFEAAEHYYRPRYADAQADVCFAYGDQWPAALRQRRLADHRLCLHENRVLAFIRQVVNDIRQTRPAVRVSPVDDHADIDTAHVLKGMVRNIEVQSHAESAYDTAAQNAVQSGYGFIRVHTRYRPGSFDQEIVIERVLNPFSVYLDPHHQRMDGSDTDYAFIFEDLSGDEFSARYPNAARQDWDDHHADWFCDESVRIAEYFYKDYQEQILYDTHLGVLSSDQLARAKEKNIAVEIFDQRRERVPVIKWCKLSGAEILEETTWLGQHIPVVPVYGDEVFVDGRREIYSLIRPAKDPQMMYNFLITTATESIALQPKSQPFIGAVGQFKSRAQRWASANSQHYPYLEYDPVDYKGQPVPPPRRAEQVQPSAAVMTEINRAAEGIKAALGIYDASLGAQSHEISGAALKQRQLKGDNASYHFIDNLATSIRQVGVILVDLIPKIYDGPRIARIIGADGAEKNVPINQAFIKDDQGHLIPAPPGFEGQGIYDLQAGHYDVAVDIGPSYATKRQEAAASLLEIARAQPKILEIAGDLLIQSLDMPYAQEISARMKAAMPPALRDDDPAAAQLRAAQQEIQDMRARLLQTQAALKDKQDKEASELALKEKELMIKAAKTDAEIAVMQAEMRERD